MTTQRAMVVVVAIGAMVAAVVLHARYQSPLTLGLIVAGWLSILVAAGSFRSYLWQRIVGAGLLAALVSWFVPRAFPGTGNIDSSTVAFVVLLMMFGLIVSEAVHRMKQKRHGTK